MSLSTVLPVSSPTPGVAVPDNPPSHPLDSPVDHRSVLEVVGWSLAIMTTLIVLARMGTRWATTRRLEIDDLLITVSLLLAFGQTASLSTAVHNGLGLLSSSDQDSVNIEGQQKSMYAFNVLFVISQCFAKVSVTVFIGSLTPVGLHRQFCKGLVASISVWATTAAIALLFQCQMPRPWQAIGGQCVNRIALYTYIEVVNAILDVVLVAIPVMMVWSLHQTRSRKMAIIGAFLTRSTVIAVIIVQLVVLHGASDSTSDPFLRWNFAICTQFIEYLSIVSACALYLKSFLQHAASGMLGHNGPGNRKHHYYQQFDGVKFETKIAGASSSGRHSKFGSDLWPQHMNVPMNIHVQRDFEMFESVTESASDSDGRTDNIAITIPRKVGV